MRAIYPAATSHRKENHPPESSNEDAIAAMSPDTDSDDPASPASDWLPLVTLVRIPTLSQLQCPADVTQPCTITGLNFFLLQAVSANPDFSSPVPVPDGFTGATLSVPHLSAATVFFKLRDDPASINSAILPMPLPPVAHIHHTTPHPAHSEDVPGQETTPELTSPTPSTLPTSVPQKQVSPAPTAPSSPSKTTPK